MNIWAIIPVKPLNRAKSRLSTALDNEERQALAEVMLRRMLSIVTRVPEIAGTLVISRDPKALSISRRYGANTVMETGTPELNTALVRATQVIIGWKSDGTLILPADLPLIEAEDIRDMVAMSDNAGERSVVIATDRAKDGTNALLVRPPGLIPYEYGLTSYAKHVMSAHKAGANLQVYESERLSLDLDVPTDLTLYRRLTAHCETNLLDDALGLAEVRRADNLAV